MSRTPSASASIPRARCSAFPKLHTGSPVRAHAANFKDKKAYRLSEAASVKYKQVVLLGVRRTRRERDQLRDFDCGDLDLAAELPLVSRLHRDCGRTYGGSRRNNNIDLPWRYHKQSAIP